MAGIENLSARMAAQVAKLAGDNAFTQSPIPQVKLLYTTCHQPRQPVMYSPSIVIIFQGKKVGYLGRTTFSYDPHNYLLLTVPLPFECETFASPEQPLAGISIGVDTIMLQDLLIDIGDDVPSNHKTPASGITPSPLGDEILCATERLLDVMIKPLDGRVLGPQIVREILFYVLTSDNGGALHALVNRHTHFSQIAKSLRRIESQYSDNLSVELLANEVNMSVSAFHHNFKAVTSTSPLQYLKTYRLHKARMLMIHDGLNAGSAAISVGYESASQFSREFKRYFGLTPTDEVTRLRDNSTTQSMR